MIALQGKNRPETALAHQKRPEHIRRYESMIIAATVRSRCQTNSTRGSSATMLTKLRKTVLHIPGTALTPRHCRAPNSHPPANRITLHGTSPEVVSRGVLDGQPTDRILNLVCGTRVPAYPFQYHTDRRVGLGVDDANGYDFQ